jgi:hypothetical protein
MLLFFFLYPIFPSVLSFHAILRRPGLIKLPTVMNLLIDIHHAVSPGSYRHLQVLRQFHRVLQHNVIRCGICISGYGVNNNQTLASITRGGQEGYSSLRQAFRHFRGFRSEYGTRLNRQVHVTPNCLDYVTKLPACTRCLLF